MDTGVDANLKSIQRDVGLLLNKVLTPYELVLLSSKFGLNGGKYESNVNLAKKFGKNRNTITYHIENALKKLKEYLDEKEINQLSEIYELENS